MLKAFAANIAGKVWENLQPWLEAKGDEAIDKYLPIVMEKLLTLLPTIVAMAVKLAVEKAFEQIPSLPNVVLPEVTKIATDIAHDIIDSDPDIPGLSDIIDISEIFRHLLPPRPGGQQ